MPIKNKSAGERDMHTVRKALYEYRAVKIVGDSPLFTAFFTKKKVCALVTHAVSFGDNTR